MNIEKKLEEIKIELTPHSDINEYRKEFDKYYGILLYIVCLCRDAYEDLKIYDQEVDTILKSKEDKRDVNQFLRQTKILCDYLPLRVRTLFDADTRTLSFIQFARFLSINNYELGTVFLEKLKSTTTIYGEEIRRMQKIADKVVAHLDKKALKPLFLEELLAMRMLKLMKNLEQLLVETETDFLATLATFTTNPKRPVPIRERPGISH